MPVIVAVNKIDKVGQTRLHRLEMVSWTDA
ncbi:MAG: hypothetical protein ACLUQK_10335 [Clostridium sp.]